MIPQLIPPPPPDLGLADEPISLTNRRLARVVPGKSVPPEEPGRRAELATRLLSFVALCAFGFGVFSVARGGYEAMTDSFIAPIILSPDSDVVIQSRLNVARVVAERDALVLRRDESKSAIEAAKLGVEKLTELREAAAASLRWTSTVTAAAAASTRDDLRTLERQKELLEASLTEQNARVKEVEGHVASGLVNKSDLAHEKGEASQLGLELLRNERERLGAVSRLQQSYLAQRVLGGTGKGGRRLQTPEMLQRQDQMVKVELELLKVQSEQRSRTALLASDERQLVILDELIGQMKSRPVFRATDGKQNVAFVPYTQIEGVGGGDPVFDCATLGIFGCREVGRVIEVVPGEVAMPDPWGTPARGQYVVLDLSDPASAQSKVLRVRSQRGPHALDEGPAMTPRAWLARR
jgi:hypothetical protein